MDCQRCKAEMKDSWNFCPRCGARKGADPDEVMGRDFFSQMLSGFKKSVEKGGTLPQFPAGGPVKIEIRAHKRPVRGAPPVRIMDGEGRPLAAVSETPASLEAREPHARMFSEGGRPVAEVMVPGVGSPRHVSIKELESSIEVRAVAEDSLYFRILKKPSGTRITGVSLSGGILRIIF